MNIQFYTNFISQQGQREHNEDSIFPNEEIETIYDNLFLVCDGVGGHAKGEIASDLVCTQINSFFTSNQIECSDASTINEALKFVETKFDSYMVKNPSAVGMASTLTLLHLHKKGATVAHVGDSRVYQFREGKIIFRTKDHSLVQNLFDIGVLKSEEEMATHSRRNEITRAIQGASIKRTQADVIVLTDIREKDIFFLCTDGVLESFSDKSLESLFSSGDPLDTIVATIALQCSKTSQDNFSAYFVEVTKEYVDSLDIESVSNPIKEVDSTDKKGESVTEIKQENNLEDPKSLATISVQSNNIKEEPKDAVETAKVASGPVVSTESNMISNDPKPTELTSSQAKSDTPVRKKKRKTLILALLLALAAILISAFLWLGIFPIKKSNTRGESNGVYEKAESKPPAGEDEKITYEEVKKEQERKEQERKEQERKEQEKLKKDKDPEGKHSEGDKTEDKQQNSATITRQR